MWATWRGQDHLHVSISYNHTNHTNRLPNNARKIRYQNRPETQKTKICTSVPVCSVDRPEGPVDRVHSHTDDRARGQVDRTDEGWILGFSISTPNASKTLLKAPNGFLSSFQHY